MKECYVDKVIKLHSRKEYLNNEIEIRKSNKGLCHIRSELQSAPSIQVDALHYIDFLRSEIKEINVELKEFGVDPS